MSDLNKPSEQPAGDLRQEIVSRTSTLIDALSAKIDAGQRQLFMEAIQKEDVPEEALQIIDSQLDNIQRLSRTDPAKALQILNKMIDVGGDGTLSPEDIQSFVTGAAPEMPESMSKISGMIEKMSTMVNQLGEQLSSLGAETLKTLGGFFGPETLFGKVLEVLKNKPKAQMVLLQKSFKLAEDTSPEEMQTILSTMNKNASSINRKPHQAPAYDFVDHVKEVRELVGTETQVTVTEIVQSSNAVTSDYNNGTRSLGPMPAPAIAAEPKKERERKEVTARIETKITENDTALLALEKITDGARLEISGKKAEIKKIGESAVTSVALLEANATDPAAVILTLADKTIQINATELKAASAANAKTTVKAKNLTANIDMTFDILFATA